jgi:hypothetical protein
MSYCGLNNVKHKPIIDELVEKGLIVRFEEPWGEQNRIINQMKGQQIYNKETAVGTVRNYKSVVCRKDSSCLGKKNESFSDLSS